MSRFAAMSFLLLLLLAPFARAQTPAPVSPQAVADAGQLVKDAQSNPMAAAADAQRLSVDLAQQWTLDSGHVRMRLGPDCAATLLTLEKTGVKPTDWGGAGPALSIDLWRTSPGVYQLHVIVEALIGGGTVNGTAGASFLPALAVGYGGYGLVPEFAVGFGPRIPLSGGPVQFAMVGSMAALTVLQEF
jgi:hypothetical protein